MSDCYLVVVRELACLNDAVNYAGSSKAGRTGYSPGGEGYSPIKVTGYLSENFENTSKRYQNLVLWECPKFISTPQEAVFLHTINIECFITILYFTRRVQY